MCRLQAPLSLQIEHYASQDAGEGGELHSQETSALSRRLRSAFECGAVGAAANGAGRGSLGHRGSIGRQAREAWNPDGGGPGRARTGRCSRLDDGDRRAHGLRAARDLLHAFGADGADPKGNRGHPKLRESGHDLDRDARSDRKLRDASCGEDAPL